MPVVWERGGDALFATVDCGADRYYLTAERLPEGGWGLVGLVPEERLADRAKWDRRHGPGGDAGGGTCSDLI